MPRRPLTADALWAIPRVGAPVPSPDGSRFVVPVTTWSLETNEPSTQLWLVSADGRSRRTLTSADASASQAAWSPDGRRLAFVRKPGPAVKAARHADQPQVHLLALDGGEAERVTDLPLGAADPRWFPDGRRLAFIAPVFRGSKHLRDVAERAKRLDEDPVKAHVTENRIYRYWDRWLTDDRVHHVFAVDLEQRDPIDLTPTSTGWFDPMEPAGQFRISPDGREIAYCAAASPPPYDPWITGVWTVRVPARLDGRARPGRPRRLLPDHPADVLRPVYSPDGRWIVVGIQRETDWYADKVRLVAIDRRTGRSTVLTESWDRSAEAWTFGADARRLFLATESEARRVICVLDLPAALRRPDRNLPREIARAGWLGSPTIAGRRLFFTRESLTSPPEVASCGLDGRGLRTLTSFTRRALSAVALGRVEEQTFDGADGERVQMFVVHPPGPRRAPRPLVHLIHGGPHGVFGDQWHWRWNAHVFSSVGCVSALVNFHGSTSWGQDFARSILGRWGDQPYRDILAATDRLIELGIADPRRLAATGGSYGGYLVSWIGSQTDRFRCLVNHAGVCDFQTQYASDVTQGRRRSMGGEPWENVAGMDRWNPMRHASGFRSPMLVIHGERDYRVPYVQGLEIYNIYKAMKRPARLVVYPDENHWILKPRNSRHWYGEVLAWLRRWLRVTGKR